MKIGILTFHRAINYGAVLQCYALSEVLKKMGHDVFVIDYRQPRVERTDRHVCSKERDCNCCADFICVLGYTIIAIGAGMRKQNESSMSFLKVFDTYRTM